MPSSRTKSWTNKEERQYEHIKDSAQKRGSGTRRAKELAARTVNKKRREKGETSNKKSSGTGNPNQSLRERSVQELKNLARQRGVKNYSKKKKSELVSSLRKKAS